MSSQYSPLLDFEYNYQTFSPFSFLIKLTLSLFMMLNSSWLLLVELVVDMLFS